MKYIKSLKPNEVFVFGSNEAGRHGAGAAKTALQWGAKWGQGEGLAGQTYAIPTKDTMVRTLPKYKIYHYVKRFLEFALENPDLTFLVTPIGCDLAGYKPHEMSSAFRLRGKIPKNVILPSEFL